MICVSPSVHAVYTYLSLYSVSVILIAISYDVQHIASSLSLSSLTAVS